MNIYKKNGYENREDYLISLADQFGLRYENVEAIAMMLGPNEDFDGLINMLEDANDETY